MYLITMFALNLSSIATATEPFRLPTNLYLELPDLAQQIESKLSCIRTTDRTTSEAASAANLLLEHFETMQHNSLLAEKERKATEKALHEVLRNIDFWSVDSTWQMENALGAILRNAREKLERLHFLPHLTRSDIELILLAHALKSPTEPLFDVTERAMLLDDYGLIKDQVKEIRKKWTQAVIAIQEGRIRRTGVRLSAKNFPELIFAASVHYALRSKQLKMPTTQLEGTPLALTKTQTRLYSSIFHFLDRAIFQSQRPH